jgi:hypothetical protein
MLAAASNCGGKGNITWPAISSLVICVHAAAGEGNAHLSTPTPLPSRDNFTTLDCAVESWSPETLGGQQYEDLARQLQRLLQLA